MAARRIAVMGAGGVGGYFGARLAAAGRDVIFIARGAHLDAIRKDGLRVESPLGDLHLKDAKAERDPAKVGPVDAVLFAVKLADTEDAARAAKPLLGPDSAIFAFQNGVESAQRIAAIVGESHVVPGVAYIAATIAEPGLIRQMGKMATLVFGEADGTRSKRVEALYEDCIAAGITTELSDDVNLAVWNKFIRLAPFSGLTALTRLSIGPVRETPQSRALLERAIDEAIAVARAQGVAFDGDTKSKVLQWVYALPPDMDSSMARDLKDGKRLEIDWLSGALARLAEQNGVAAPTHAFIAAALAPHANGKGKQG